MINLSKKYGFVLGFLALIACGMKPAPRHFAPLSLEQQKLSAAVIAKQQKKAKDIDDELSIEEQNLAYVFLKAEIKKIGVPSLAHLLQDGELSVKLHSYSLFSVTPEGSVKVEEFIKEIQKGVDAVKLSLEEATKAIDALPGEKRKKIEALVEAKKSVVDIVAKNVEVVKAETAVFSVASEASEERIILLQAAADARSVFVRAVSDVAAKLL